MNDGTAVRASLKRASVEAILDLRRRRRRMRILFGLLVFAIVAWSIDVTIIKDTDWARMGSVSNVLKSASGFFGFDFKVFLTLLEPAVETLMIACLGTLVGVVICIPATWFGALNITPWKPLTYPIGRLLMTLSRSIHEIVWALFFVAVVGLGALAGVFAVAVRSVGFIAKMSAEAIEDIKPGPVEAIKATGASPFQVLLYAIIPQVLPQVLSVVIFEWEINIRRSSILGLVGAGGLGLVFFRQMNTFNFHGVTAVIVAILCLILIGEIVSYYARKAVI